MELLDRYLKAVRLYLPRAHKDDIVRELCENLLAAMDDREKELGRPLAKADVQQILRQHGHPMIVAGGYHVNRRSVTFGRQWISPQMFPFYVRHLWLNLIITVVFVAVVALAGKPIVVPLLLFSIGLQFVILTVVYSAMDALMRRSQLPAAPLPLEFPIPRWQSKAGIALWAVFTLWWLSIPVFPVVLFGPAAGVLRIAPTIEGYNVPIVLLLLAGIAQRVTNLIRPEWTRLLPLSRLAINGIGLILIYRLIQHHPFVVVMAGTHDAHDIGLAATFNSCIEWGVVKTWLWIYFLANFVAHGLVCLDDLRWRILRQRNRIPSHAL
ncbi:MAG TPA: hypothetical protein VKU01_17535 [Bryobacteraceae bacterium]|nr:hypothetical protein [Bryobacteraceae bacterium]